MNSYLDAIIGSRVQCIEDMRKAYLRRDIDTLVNIVDALTFIDNEENYDLLVEAERFISKLVFYSPL